MRIVYITANLPHGSSEAFIVPEIRALGRLGHQVLVVPRSPKGGILHGQELLGQSRTERLLSRRVLAAAIRRSRTAPRRSVLASSITASRSLSIAAKNTAVLAKGLWLAEIADDWRADHMHCHWAGTTATMTMVASAASGVPWSFTAHRWDIVENNLFALKTAHAAFVRFISDDGLKMARAYGIGPEEKLRVIRMGVAVAGAAAEPKPGRKAVVLCPARLSAVKGHRYLLEAWRTLRDRHAEAELWLAGEGELRADIESRIRASGLAGCVKLLGAVPHRDLLRMYETGSIAAVVLPSVDLGNGYHEGVPVALIEAMSYAVPVVATATGGILELIRPGAGMLAPPADPDALASALDALLDNPALAAGLGAAGRRRAADVHDIRRIAAELSALFEAHADADARRVA